MGAGKCSSGGIGRGTRRCSATLKPRGFTRRAAGGLSRGSRRIVRGALAESGPEPERPSFHRLAAIDDDRVVYGKLPTCDHCGAPQIFGNTFVLRISWCSWELCDECVLGLVMDMKETVMGGDEDVSDD